MEDYIQRNRANVQAKKASALRQQLAKPREPLHVILARIHANIEARKVAG